LKEVGKTTGVINKILPNSFVDGPGNRTVVFVQGCNMHCAFCHNPYTINICDHCGLCVEGCPTGALSIEGGEVLWDSALCEECDQCINCCPNFSSPRTTQYTPLALWDEIRTYGKFISGVTVSGGEPTMQVEFLRNFFFLVKNDSDLTTLVETNGLIETRKLVELLPVMDYAMVDLKVFDTGIHRELTGVGNHATLETIRFLAQHSKLFAVRTTVIPGYSDALENAFQTAQFIASIDPNIRLSFLRFRPHGTRGQAEHWDSPSDELMDTLVDAARSQGVIHVDRSI
jgi:YjjW family glycine radical enzyme activase